METGTNVKSTQEIPRQADMIFDQAIRRTLAHEGGLSDDPVDAGGITKFGISIRWLRQYFPKLNAPQKKFLFLKTISDVTPDYIRKLTIERAVFLYKIAFWDPFPYTKLSPAVAIKAFDLNVNMGAKQAHFILQRAVKAANPSDAVKEDGVLGPDTIKAINRQYAPALSSAIRAEAASFYRLLATQRPAQKKFLKGWLNRAYS